MTRQKKEIIKKINDIDDFIAADEELGCGFAPPDAYAPLYERIHSLYEELARISHYSSVEEMMNDDRWMRAEQLPFA